LEELPLPECLHLLGCSTLGRISVVVDGTPEIFPVNHSMDPETGCIVFPTNNGTKLHAAMHWPRLSFEVDGVDADGTSGWSVMVLGHAEIIKTLGELARGTAARPVPWSPSGAVWVRIVPERITGRRISAVATYT
jgi:uncharacterized protein